MIEEIDDIQAAEAGYSSDESTAPPAAADAPGPPTDASVAAGPPPLPSRWQRARRRLVRTVDWARSHPGQAGVFGGGLLLLVLLAALLPGQAGPAAGEPLAPRAVEGLVLRPRENVIDSFELTGSIEANRVVNVAAEVSARVDDYAGRRDRCENGELILSDSPPLREGDSVVKGQLLVRLNTDLLKAQRDAAKAEFEFLEADVKRMKQSFEQGVATPLEVDEVLMKYKMAKANLDLAEAQLERACIVAPIGGVLNKLPVEIGEYVQPGLVIAEIVEPDPVKIAINIPEKDIAFFRVGESQQIHHDTPDGTRSITGEISYISETADPLAHTTRIEITVPNPPVNGKRQLRDGDIVRVELVRRVLHDQIMIPVRAIVPMEKGYAVFVAIDGKAERRLVNPDQRMLKNQEVRLLPPTEDQQQRAELAGEKAGVNPAEILILQPARVGPGQPVTIVDLDGNRGPVDPAAEAATIQPMAATQPAEATSQEAEQP